MRLRVEREYGSDAGRLWPYIHLVVPSDRVPGEAFAITPHRPEDLRGNLLWHRLDLAAGAVLDTRDLRTSAQSPVDISPDGELVAFIRYGALRVRTSAGDLRWRSGGWAGARFTAGGARVLAISAEGHFAELDTATGAELWRRKGFGPVAFSADGRLVAYRPDRDHLALCDRHTDERLAVWTTVPQPCVVLAGGDVLGLRYPAADAGELFRLTPGRRSPLWIAPVAGPPRWPVELALDEERGALVVPLGTGLEERRIDDGAPLRTHPLAGGAVRFSGDRRRAVRWAGARYSDWSLAGGERRTGSGHAYAAGPIGRSPDGALLASEAGWALRLWDAASGREIRRIRTSSGPGGSPRFTPDGALVVLGRQAWRVADGSEAPSPYPVPSNASAWSVSADGRLLWLRTADGCSLTRLADGAELWRTDRGDAAAFTDDGLVTVEHEFQGGGGGWRSRLLWVRDGGVEPVALRPQSGLTPADRCWLSPGFLAAHRFGECSVFDTRTGARLGALAEVPQDIAFGGDRWLFALGHDRRVAVYALPEVRLAGHVPVAAQAIAAPDAHTLLVSTARGVLRRYAVA